MLILKGGLPSEKEMIGESYPHYISLHAYISHMNIYSKNTHPPRFSASSWLRSRNMTASGAGNPYRKRKVGRLVSIICSCTTKSDRKKSQIRAIVPTSHDIHQSSVKSPPDMEDLSSARFALVNATPLYAYRSQIMFVPLDSVSIRFGAASHRLALNNKWMARSSVWTEDWRYSLIKPPTN